MVRAALLATLLLAPASALRAATLPEGFTDAAVIVNLSKPTAVRFAPDGRVFVAEKRGRIKVYTSLTDTSFDPFVDLGTNVQHYWDRGLLGLALHPDFPAAPYVYVLYTYDYDPATPEIPAPRWGDACPTPPGPTTDGCVVTGRLSRLQISPTNTLVGGEQVLLEGNWCQQFPSHSLGALNFGPEGALYVQAGEGAHFELVDYGQTGGSLPDTPTPRNPCGDPPAGRGGVQAPPGAEGGALRAQDLRTPGDPVTWDGSVLRIDPHTGAAWPGNPLAGGGTADDDRTIAHGLRNPFRSVFRPGTGELWIGDVGWHDWEEINRLVAAGAPMENFGWPCYEGSARQPEYDGANLAICEDLYAAGTGAVVAPFFAYAGAVDPDGDACGEGGSSISGLAFYGAGTYPSSYEGALFFADYTRNCIYVMQAGVDGLPDPTTSTAFAVGATSPVDLQRGPGGDLYYVDIDGGTVRRIQYTSGNTPPTARAAASPDSGPVPLTVQFDGSGSSDPDPGATLFHRWDLDGDGAYDDASIANPVRTYATPGSVVVGLQVTDDRGGVGTDTITIHPGNTRPVATVTAPGPALRWRVGDVIVFSGTGTDAEDGAVPASAMHWDIHVHHCPGGASDCHPHLLEQHDGVSTGSVAAPDHEWYSYLEFVLTVRDGQGLEGRDSMPAEPLTVTNSYASSPPGLALLVGGATGTAPFDRPAIVGGTTSLGAPSPQWLQGTQYYWTSWSDGGAQSHAFVAGDAPEQRSATFALCGATEPCDGLDNDCDGAVDDAAPPPGARSVQVTDTEITWSPMARAQQFDVVRGDLRALRDAAGDFAASTEECLADDHTGTSLAYAGAPAPQQGFWFLVRAVNCGGPGTYDSEASSQVGPRDAEIAASPDACP